MATSSIIGTITDIEHKAVGRVPCASLLLTLVALIIHLTNGLRVDLLYERTALAGLQLWRVVTCHWVHLNWDHLFWSGATFLFLGSLCEILDKKRLTRRWLSRCFSFPPLSGGACRVLMFTADYRGCIARYMLCCLRCSSSANEDQAVGCGLRFMQWV